MIRLEMLFALGRNPGKAARTKCLSSIKNRIEPRRRKTLVSSILLLITSSTSTPERPRSAFPNRLLDEWICAEAAALAELKSRHEKKKLGNSADKRFYL